MKKIIFVLAALAMSLMTFAQTPEEIVSKMEEQMALHEGEGVIWTMDLKIPILGTFTSDIRTLGKKTRMEAVVKGANTISWMNETTSWTYTADSNILEIENVKIEKAEDATDDVKMFRDVTKGYDVTLASETEKEWLFLCKKSKSNKEKNAPRTVELVIAKGTYYPVRLSAKLKGVTMTIRNVGFGVSEEEVTFHPEDYPNAIVQDKR